ncbi:MAG: hypothetical protein PHI36_03300 [Bacteroidales bacterium]|jgi:uncharacterized protein YhbP (UPF0306 family)|nr:hypothetical protein [Bacteroidales bacterium]MDD4575435.1 hypothetical protein [Bacteroidales bacterium]
MNQVDERILKFIHKHHVLNLSTYSNGEIWTCSCFYAFDSENMQFIITSDLNTKHAQHALENPEVSGTIVLETKIVGNIQGIQFSGNLLKLNDVQELNARKVYLKKFPFAVLIKTSLWVIPLYHIKFTNNRLGFGKKIFWNFIHNKSS